MSATSFAAWGSIDVEKMDRLQRRNYINKVRAELKAAGYSLHSGGQAPIKAHYALSSPAETKVFAARGEKAFQKVCLWFVQQQEKKHGTIEGVAEQHDA
jgi:hypothetical protein